MVVFGYSVDTLLASIVGLSISIVFYVLTAKLLCCRCAAKKEEGPVSILKAVKNTCCRCAAKEEKDECCRCCDCGGLLVVNGVKYFFFCNGYSCFLIAGSVRLLNYL